MRWIHLHKAAVRNGKRLANEADAEATRSHMLPVCACTHMLQIFRPSVRNASGNGAFMCRECCSRDSLGKKSMLLKTCALLQLLCLSFQKGSQEYKSQQANLWSLLSDGCCCYRNRRQQRQNAMQCAESLARVHAQARLDHTKR